MSSLPKLIYFLLLQIKYKIVNLLLLTLDVWCQVCLLYYNMSSQQLLTRAELNFYFFAAEVLLLVGWWLLWWLVVSHWSCTVFNYIYMTIYVKLTKSEKSIYHFPERITQKKKKTWTTVGNVYTRQFLAGGPNFFNKSWQTFRTWISSVK